MGTSNIKRNFLYNLIKTCSSVLFPLLTFPYVSRVLLPDSIGKYDFSQSFVSYFALIATLGITTYAVRECSIVKGDSKQLNKTVSEIFSINVVTTFIAYMLLLLTIFSFESLAQYRLLIAILSVSIIMTTLGVDWINTAMEDFKYITFRTFFFQLVSLILLVAFVHEPKDLYKYTVITLVSSSGVCILNFFYIKRFCSIRFTWNMNLKKHITPIMTLFVMLLAQSIFNNADKTMLGLLQGDYYVGIYSTAVKVINIVRQLILSVLWVVMPKLSLAFENKKYDEINSLLNKLLNFTITLGLPCFIGIELLANNIILIIAGDSYTMAANVLRILMVSLLFSFFGGNFLGNIIMLPSKKEKIYMIACSVATLINFLLNFWTIKIWHVNGAAFTTALAELLIMLMLVPFVDKQIKIAGVVKMLISPVIGCVWIACTCLVLTRFIEDIYISTFGSIIVSSIGYFIVLLVMKNELVFDVFQRLLLKGKDK